MILRTFCPFFVFLFVKYLCLPERRLVIGYIYKKEDCDCRYGECPTELRSSARQAHFAEKPVDFHSLQFFRQGLDVHTNRFQSDESGHFLTNRFRWSFGCTTHADRHFYLVQNNGIMRPRNLCRRCLHKFFIRISLLEFWERLLSHFRLERSEDK